MHALKTGTKVDGEVANKFYMTAIDRTVRMKISEASAGLCEVYKEFPQYRRLIENSLSWLNHTEQKKPTKPKAKPEESSAFPDPEEIASWEKVQPDPVSAFKDFS